MGKGFPGCAAVGCTNNYGNNSKYSLFIFPRDEKRAKMWAIAAGRNDLLESVHKLFKKRLCSAHFEERMYKNERRNRLSDTAVPTIFRALEGSSSKALKSEQGIKRPLQSQQEKVVPATVVKVTNDERIIIAEPSCLNLKVKSETVTLEDKIEEPKTLGGIISSCYCASEIRKKNPQSSETRQSERITIESICANLGEKSETVILESKIEEPKTPERNISSCLSDVQECKTRWRSLRDLYHRKKKDQKMGKKIRSPWEYMEHMAFLEDFTTEKK
ncbi:uncharacterized protein LOC115887295 [Sitophilus oryzae]|uniref:Uncharacterized protein LOC115887295 n=1 Tax=Sitophilus oryzae TaxID=7048 RepID=A0A6J2YGZ0_SITOR|nr:uncharacterized protein LOC115887295 [Sitophilus oryzae]